ncbi:MAG: protein translocase subunit SecF [Proteobacteria bacterium]|nr:protein translocase subunit SecF [Pseudomonadota bacterium]
MRFKLVPDQTNFDFMRLKWACLVLSVLMFVGTFVSLFAQGLNYGIDFAGGTLVQLKTEKVVDIADIRNSLKSQGWVGLVIQEYGAPDEILIRIPGDLEKGQSAVMAEKVRSALDGLTKGTTVRRVEYVGPQIGAELKKRGLTAILLSCLAIVIYVSLRFEFRFGVAAVVALVHDVLLTVGVFSFLQKEITMPVLAAVLTIIGYSLNDTIVVFDRVRENMRRYKRKELSDVLNLSVNEMLNRTIMMTLTTLVVLVALFVWGGEVIHDFAFALLFGVLVGTYSSTYIAAPVVLWMQRFNFGAEGKGTDGADDTAASDKSALSA